MDFDSRINKFDKEKEKRKKLAKEKYEQEIKLKEQQKEREKQQEELAERKRIEQAEIALQNEIKEQEELQRTGGIKVNLTLQSILIEIENDKIKLPTSALTLLNDQGAFLCGRPVMFQIEIKQPYNYCATRLTHCGVLEFTAEEGTVELPTKVYYNLFDNNNNNINNNNIVSLPPPIVELKYVVLPKITSVQFQPKLNIFSQLGPIKLILEENLQQHTTLTVGDILTIWYRGHSYDIIVKSIQPNELLVHSGGTVIDTNIEVDLDCSEEYLKESQNNNNNNVNKNLSSQLNSLVSNNSTLIPSISSTTLPSQPNTTITTTTTTITTNTYTLPILPNEPSIDELVVTFKFLFPSGGNFKRRFLLNAPIQEIFDYLHHTIHNSFSNDIGKQIQISTRQAPIQIYKENDINSLQELILNSGLVVVPSSLSSSNPTTINRKLFEVLVVSYL